MDQVRRAGTVTARIAMLQFEWDRPEIKAIFETLDVAPNYGYFLLRSAPLGRCNPSLVGDAMAFFPPKMVSKIVERTWQKVGPQEVLEVGVRQMSEAAEGVYGEIEGVEELAQIYETVVAELDTSGRILSSAWRTVPWPDLPASQLFGAATTLREYRGDGHIAAVVANGISPLEARMLAAATSSEDPVAKATTFGWREGEVGEALEELQKAGLLSGTEVTSAGLEMWEDIEELTDRLAAPAWDPLGDQLERLIGLGEDGLATVGAPTRTGR